MQIRQPGFSGGLLDPLFEARTDLKRYHTSLAQCINGIVTPAGAVVRRGGTSKLLKFSGGNPTRLIPFVFTAVGDAESQNHIIVAESDKFTIYQLYPHFQLEATITGTGFSYAMLFELKFAQTGDEMIITHRTTNPMVLKRIGQFNWTYTALQVSRSISMPSTVGISNVYAGDAANPAKKWSWAVTAVAAESAGGDESLPRVTVEYDAAIYSTHPVTVTWAAVAGAASYNIYRGRNGYYGYVGHVPASKTTFYDDGIAPVLSEPPPQERNPWGGGTDYYPSVVALFQQRLIVANSWNDPAKVWGSQTGSLKNFDAGFPPRDDDSLTFAIATKQYEEIRSIVAMKQLLIFTNAGEWICGGSQGPLTPKDIDLKIQSYNGSGWLDPLIVDNIVLYAQEKGRQVREFAYDQNQDNYGGQDLAVYAKYLFDNGRILSWCFQEYPHRVVWIVKTDGTVVGLTYDRQNEVIAWHKHDFGGTVADMVCIPANGTDRVYLLIQRENGMYLEVMTNQNDGVFTDRTEPVSATVHDVPDLANQFVYVYGFDYLGEMNYYWEGVVPANGHLPDNSYPNVEWSGYVGVPLPVTLELLNAALPMPGDGRAQLKNVRKVFWEVSTRGEVTLGESANNMVPYTPATSDRALFPRTADGVIPYQLLPVTINPSWNRNGRSLLKFQQPYEYTVISAIREVEVGGS